MFANHLPRIGVLNGNSDSTGCVRGGREQYVIILSFFIHLWFFRQTLRESYAVSFFQTHVRYIYLPQLFTLTISKV